MRRVYIADGKRSYIGIENGMYRHIPAEILGAGVLKSLLASSSGQIPDCIIAGNGVGAGGNISRLMVLEAGLDTVPAYTIDVQCGSGLESIAVAHGKVAMGQAECVYAGGFESSSTAPVRSYNKNHPDYEKYGGANGRYKVAKFSPGTHDTLAMIKGAERTAFTSGIRREDLNAWVLRSHRLAAAARDEHRLDGITVEVVPGKHEDEGIRSKMSEKLLDRLPALLKDGSVMTAANTCLINDGAAFLSIVSGEYADRYCIKPMAELIDHVLVAGNPLESPKTAIYAIERLLCKNGLDDSDIDIFECNEAFAVIDELFARKYPSAVTKYNIYGGALAYGHPYGASGGIIALHACTALRQVRGKYAVCSIAAAGGVGCAMLIKSCSGLK